MATKLAGTLTLDQNVIQNQHYTTDTAHVLDADKQQHLFRLTCNFDLPVGSTPVARHEIIFVAQAAGTIRGFSAGCWDTGTSASVTFDLKKNNTTCLSSVITVSNADSDKAVEDGTLSVTSFVADDILSVDLAVSSSTGMTGPFCLLTVEENTAAP